MSEPASVPPERLLFAGTHGHVLALDKTDGKLVWDTSLPSTGYDVVAILFEDGRLFCASGGRVFALDPPTGKIEWQNELPGMGRGLVYLATCQSNDTEAVLTLLARESAKKAAAQASGGT